MRGGTRLRLTQLFIVSAGVCAAGSARAFGALHAGATCADWLNYQQLVMVRDVVYTPPIASEPRSATVSPIDVKRAWEEKKRLASASAPPPSLMRCPALDQGVASWYGPGFDGRKTKSGEVFDQDALTAASNTIPLGTMVCAVNNDNGRAEVAWINDTGGFAKYARVLDGSRGLARALGYIDSGTANVTVMAADCCDQFPPLEVAEAPDSAPLRRSRGVASP